MNDTDNEGFEKWVDKNYFGPKDDTDYRIVKATMEMAWQAAERETRAAIRKEQVDSLKSATAIMMKNGPTFQEALDAKERETARKCRDLAKSFCEGGIDKCWPCDIANAIAEEYNL